SLSFYTNDPSRQIESAIKFVQRFLTVYSDFVETNRIDPKFWTNFAFRGNVEVRVYLSLLAESVITLRRSPTNFFLVECFQDPALPALIAGLDPLDKSQRLKVPNATVRSEYERSFERARRRFDLGIWSSDPPKSVMVDNITFVYSNDFQFKVE